MHAGGPGGALPARLQLQPAVQVVGEGRRDERHDQHHRQEADHEAQPRQVKTKNADVQVELRVRGAERHPVAPQQERLPLASGAGAGEQAEDDGDADRGQATQRLDGLAVLVEVLLLGGDRGVDRPAAVADDQAGGDQRAGEDGAHGEQQDLGGQLGDEDGPEAQRVEPQHVGPHAGRQRAEEAEGHQDRDGGAQGAAAASEHRPPAAPAAAGAARASGRSRPPLLVRGPARTKPL